MELNKRIKLIYKCLKLTKIGLNLTKMRVKLTKMGLKLTKMCVKLTYIGWDLKLSHMLILMMTLTFSAQTCR